MASILPNDWKYLFLIDTHLLRVLHLHFNVVTIVDHLRFLKKQYIMDYSEMLLYQLKQIRLSNLLTLTLCHFGEQI